MIEGQRIVKGEKEYRAVLLDSSSSLKVFSQNRKKYYKLFIEGKKEDEDDDTKAILTGKVVECLLLEPELFDSKFYLSSILKAPTGKMLDFVNALVKLTFNCSDDEGNITRTFEEMAIEARTLAMFDWSLKVILDKFTGNDPEIYYNEIRNVRSNGLSVVTIQDVTNAEKIVEELKTNFVTKDIIDLVDSQRWTIKNQLQIEGFSIDGHIFKAMLDKCVICHQEKTVTPWDVKCTFSVEGFFSDYYLYRRGYFQAYLYKQACYKLIEILGLEGYTVNNIKYIVCDSINYFNPLIYETSNQDMEDAYNGFTYNGRYYPGVKETIESLQWALDNNIWNISKENYLTNGIVSLRK